MRIQKNKSEKSLDGLISKAKLAHKVGGHLFRVEGHVVSGDLLLFWTNTKKKIQERSTKVAPSAFSQAFERLTEVVHTLNQAPAK